MEEIKPGVVVQLKSGGPKMTVSFIRDEEAFCQWFTKEEKKEALFPILSLQIPSPPTIGVF